MDTDKATVRLGRSLPGVAVLLLLLPASAATGEAYKVPGTKSGFVRTADRVRIHYLEAGKGSAILFVPGWTMPAWIWEHQIVHFAKTHRVVAMDPRSQGESSQATEGHYPAARAIKAVVDQLELAPVVLVGWSMGVMEAVAYVDQFGTGAVAGLVLVDGFAGSEFDPAQTPQAFQWAHSFQLDRRKATEAFVRGLYMNPEVKADESYLQLVLQAALRTPTNSAMALLLAYFATDLRPALAKVDKPTLIVVARSPWMKYYKELQQLTPGSRLEVFEGVGHALFADDPGRFNRVLEEFLQPLWVKLPGPRVKQQK